MVKLTREQLEAVVEVVESSVRPGDSPLDPMIPDGITVRFLIQKCVGIKGATTLLKVSHHQYTRALLWDGKIEGVKVRVGNIEKWYVTKESIKYYTKHHSRHNKPKRYDFRIFPDAEDQVRAALDALGIEYVLEVAYRAPKKGGVS